MCPSEKVHQLSVVTMAAKGSMFSKLYECNFMCSIQMFDAFFFLNNRSFRSQKEFYIYLFFFPQFICHLYRQFELSNCIQPRSF